MLFTTFGVKIVYIGDAVQHTATHSTNWRRRIRSNIWFDVSNYRHFLRDIRAHLLCYCVNAVNVTRFQFVRCSRVTLLQCLSSSRWKMLLLCFRFLFDVSPVIMGNWFQNWNCIIARSATSPSRRSLLFRNTCFTSTYSNAMKWWHDGNYEMEDILTKPTLFK